MVRVVRSKREFRCTQCSTAQIKWEGICRNCGGINTLQEIVLIPTKDKPRGTNEARRLRRRAKDSERGIARRMLEADGADPAFKNIASSTGRIGHITGIRVDAVSKNYVTENKNRKVPTWMIDAWILIQQRAHDFNKNALLHVEPPNMPKEIPVNGKLIKLDTMAIISQDRHEELIHIERAYHMAINLLHINPAYIKNLNSEIAEIEDTANGVVKPTN